jgi:hypothetical protein
MFCWKVISPRTANWRSVSVRAMEGKICTLWTNWPLHAWDLNEISKETLRIHTWGDRTMDSRSNFWTQGRHITHAHDRNFLHIKEPHTIHTKD